MLAPLAGGYLGEWFGWRSTFYGVSAIGGAVLGLAWLLLHETHHKRHGGEGPLAMLRGFGVLLRDGAFAGYALNISFTTAVFFAFLAGAPYVMIELMERPSREYGIYFMPKAVRHMPGKLASCPTPTPPGTHHP